MEQSHVEQLTAAATKKPAVFSYYELIGAAAQFGFFLRHQTDGAAILEHSENKAVIFLSTEGGKQRGHALRILRKYLA